MKNEVNRALVAKKNKFQSKSVPRGTRTIWRYLGAFILFFTLSIGQMWALKPDLTPTVAEGNTPAVPATALNMTTQEFRTPDANGWIVFYTKGVVDQSGITWWGKTQTNGGTATWAVPTGASAPEAPYVGGSSTNRYTINTSRCHAIRFTGAEKLSFLVKDHASRTIIVKLYSYTATPEESLSLVTTKQSSNSAAVQEILFSSLTTSTDYVAYIYCDNSSNVDLYEVGVKGSSSSDPVAVTGITLAPSSATIKVGKTVTLVPTITPSDATDKAVTWAVTSGSTYASVSNAGVVTGLVAGSAVITATAHDGSGITQTATITVEDCPTSGTLFSMTVTDPDGTVYTDVTNAAPQLIGATYTGGQAYATSTSSSKRSPKITGNEFDFNVSSSSSVAVKVELECPLAEGDIISFTSTHTKEFKIQKVAGTNLYTTTSLSFAIPSESSLIGEDVLYVLCNNSACSFSEINITHPIYRTITLEYADGTTSDGSLKVIDGEKATKPSDPTWAHHRFDGWYNGASPYDWTANVSGDLTLTAHWTQLYTITYANGDEGATGDAPTQADKAAGETFKVAANSFELAGKVFDHWNDGTNDYDPDDTYTVGTSDVTLTAVWRTPSTMYAITEGTHTNGSITIDPVEQEEGEIVTLEATPDENYLFSAWEVVKTEDGSATGITVDANGQFEMPAYAVTVNATFTADPRTKVLYVTSNTADATKANDKLYDALKDIYNVKIVGPTSDADQSGYALVVLHESVGGGNYNATAIAAAKTGTTPVLNTKSYFYTSARWNWGSAGNGKKTKGVHVNTAYCNITDHPLFSGLTPGANDSIIILSSLHSDGKPIQPVTSFVSGKEGYTLANVPDGCAIQELTPAQRGAESGKYLLISLYSKDFANLNADGQKLFQNAAAYLVGNTAWEPVEGMSNEAISAPGNPFTEDDNITLTASATGTTAATTYAWYKGDTWAEAETAGVIQAAETAENNGNKLSINSCTTSNAGTYWCVIVKSTGCEKTASVTVSVLTCTKPGTPANLAASNEAYTTADLAWDAADNADGYKISIVKKSDASVVVDWTDCATNSYEATGLTQGTEYTFKVKAKGATGYCEFGIEATVDFTTTAPSVADLVTIADDYTFTPSVSIPAGTLSADSKFFAAGTGDCDMSDGKMRVKENRALAFKVADNAKIKVTFATKSGRQIQLGTALSEGNYTTYGSSESNPYTFDVVTTGGVVYLTAHSDQLYFSKLEIMYPHSVTYDLNGGTGDPAPTQASKYVGETFTAHDGVTGITAPLSMEFDKWIDQDAADVTAGATYTMPAKTVTLTAQWKAETTKYAVSYDLNGYTGGVAPTETNKSEGAIFAVKAAPERENYDFLGWKCNIDEATYQASDNYTMTAAPTTFTAQWKQYFMITYMDGSTQLDEEKVYVGDSPVGITDPSKEDYIFAGWTLSGSDEEVDVTTIVAATTLYAKWTADPCTDRKSIVKAVMASTSTATVTGYNDNEYAGGYIINNLAGGDNANTYDFGDGDVTGYKLKGSGSAIFATLKKGGFQVNDRVTFALTGAASSLKLAIYAAKDKDHVVKLTEIDAASAGTYTYRLTSADIAAIAAAGEGYLSIGSYRGDYNPFIYSVELTGCRDWSVFHTLTFAKEDDTEIAAEQLAEGAYASTVAPTAPKVSGYHFVGWSETKGGSTVDLTAYTITTDKTLYAVYAANDCSGNGVMFSMVAKANDLSSDYSLSGTTEESIGDYATVTGGEVYLNNNNSSTRVKITQTTSVIQLTGGDEGYIHVLLDCPLKENDIITVDNTNKWVIAHNSSKTDNVSKTSSEHTFIIPASWEDKDEFYIWRNGSSCNISTITVSRPAVFAVSFDVLGHGSAPADLTDVLEGSKITAPTAPTDEDFAFAGWYKENTLDNEWDFNNDVVSANTTLFAKWLDKSDATLKSLKYGTTDIELEDGIYEYEIALPSATASVPALTAVTNNPAATVVVTDDDAFDGDGKATSTVEVTPQKEGAATQTYTVNFTKLAALPQVDVTVSTLWNFSQAVAGKTSLENVADVVLANLPGITNDETFNSQALEGTFNKLPGGYFQGSKLMFTVAEEGLLTIEFSGTNDKARHLQVCTGDGETVIADWNYNNTTHQTKSIEIPAGKVTLKAFEGEGAQNVRIYNLEYLTLAHRRTSGYNAGDLGTVCLEDATIIDGANLYELAGLDKYGYLAFDQITSGELEAGKPYLFEVTNPSKVSFYKPVGAAHSDTEIETNGMIGTFTGTTLYQNAAQNYYYFSGRHIWRVNDFTVSIPLGAHRCYVDMDVLKGVTASSNPAPGRSRVLLGVNGAQVATGMENAQSSETGVQKILINGEMYILRGEKMYDATGRLVK